ncbi:hypothetical protein D3C73_1466770 [compost metagenome]
MNIPFLYRFLVTLNLKELLTLYTEGKQFFYFTANLYLYHYLTVTRIVTVFPPNLAFMLVLPFATATILPSVTVATEGFELVQTALLATEEVLPVS